MLATKFLPRATALLLALAAAACSSNNGGPGTGPGRRVHLESAEPLRRGPVVHIGGAQIGASAFITKPFSNADIVDRVSRFVGG